MESDIKFAATTMGNFAQPNKVQRPADMMCQSCGGTFRPHMIVKSGGCTRPLYRCESCHNLNKPPRGLSERYLRQRESQLRYRQTQRAKTAHKRHQERTQCGHS
jgi:uncharacterized Zn finger protein